MSKRGLSVFPAAASLVNFAFGRGASMHCRGLLKGRSRFCSPVCGDRHRRTRRVDGVAATATWSSTPSMTVSTHAQVSRSASGPSTTRGSACSRRALNQSSPRTPPPEIRTSPSSTSSASPRKGNGRTTTTRSNSSRYRESATASTRACPPALGARGRHRHAATGVCRGAVDAMAAATASTRRHRRGLASTPSPRKRQGRRVKIR